VLRVGSWVGVFEEVVPGDGALGFSEIGFGMMGGATLRAAIEPARRAARSNLPIILRGETGTGKEVASRAIHAWSERPGPFCAVNCAALPENLVEGELFGYRRGAFTGADRNNPGYFRRADRGTLLLDEINELRLGVQAKLLRVLQEGQVVPLGDSAPVDVDVRIVVAAQAPMAQEVAAGRFREDLYMRLQGLEIELPPLRQRAVDVAALFMGFVREYSAGGAPPRVEGKLIESLCLYAWPGNVRELELTARRLLAVHADEPLLRRRFLSPQLLARAGGMDTQPPEDDLTRLGRALERTGGNLSRACSELQISRQRAYRLLDGVSVKEFMAGVEPPSTD
jgi:transcriptional regulator with PAS, ATPase and Fis domain